MAPSKTGSLSVRRALASPAFVRPPSLVTGRIFAPTTSAGTSAAQLTTDRPRETLKSKPNFSDIRLTRGGSEVWPDKQQTTTRPGSPVSLSLSLPLLPPSTTSVLRPPFPVPSILLHPLLPAYLLSKGYNSIWCGTSYRDNCLPFLRFINSRLCIHASYCLLRLFISRTLTTLNMPRAAKEDRKPRRAKKAKKAAGLGREGDEADLKHTILLLHQKRVNLLDLDIIPVTHLNAFRAHQGTSTLTVFLPGGLAADEITKDILWPQGADRMERVKRPALNQRETACSPIFVKVQGGVATLVDRNVSEDGATVLCICPVCCFFPMQTQDAEKIDGKPTEFAIESLDSDNFVRRHCNTTHHFLAYELLFNLPEGSLTRRPYLCLETGCAGAFGRQDARLEHYKYEHAGIKPPREKEANKRIPPKGSAAPNQVPQQNNADADGTVASNTITASANPENAEGPAPDEDAQGEITATDEMDVPDDVETAPNDDEAMPDDDEAMPDDDGQSLASFGLAFAYKKLRRGLTEPNGSDVSLLLLEDDQHGDLDSDAMFVRAIYYSEVKSLFEVHARSSAEALGMSFDSRNGLNYRAYEQAMANAGPSSFDMDWQLHERALYPELADANSFDLSQFVHCDSEDTVTDA
ncbi:hypothetical protein BXZ70DRAFT_907966 [Cristinia sonorae]|uniref:C2H2-type domain-containing protein n=1 Tax=Cristinia sonorae TaxID=1940300 RepID=A0A8K0UNU6_9AGAR|nr:hypothetical protein BXZ70DRAFT_907966 [Cristinia sonorae]